MKQIITVICLIIFVVFSSYIILNEKGFDKPSKRERAQKVTLPFAKKALSSTELKPFELQKKRIESESIIEFQNTDTRESYKLDEEEISLKSYELKKSD